MNREQYEITLQDIDNDVLELIKRTKFSGIKEIKLILETQLVNYSKNTIYHLSDVEKKTQKIVKMVIVSTIDLVNHCKAWGKFGLGVPVFVMGGKRFKRSFDLEDFGINISNNPSNNTISKEERKE